MSDLAVGLRGQATRIVTAELTAEMLGSGDVPVFGTPALLAMMEDAAVDAIKGRLDAGMVTVGTWAEIEHLGASKLGAHVRATAELTGADERALSFEVEAFDGDRVIGRGKHRRAIVDKERFLARL